MQHSSLQDLIQAKENFQKIETEWLQSLDNLRSTKRESINKDLFSVLEYLMSCDIFSKNSCIELKKIHAQFQKFSEMKNELKGDSLRLIDELISDIKFLKMNIRNKLGKLNDEYSVLSEETLSKVQDLITQCSESKSNYISIKDVLNQDLDRKLFLQELKDSLENYRQAREECVSESAMEDLRKLPSDVLMPEDLGEEVPEIDPILSQLDTAITECDYALLISENTETE